MNSVNFLTSKRSKEKKPVAVVVDKESENGVENLVTHDQTHRKLKVSLRLSVFNCAFLRTIIASAYSTYWNWRFVLV